jgi:membrane protein
MLPLSQTGESWIKVAAASPTPLPKYPHAAGRTSCSGFYRNVSGHRVVALAAGMTFYSLLAIFPALAAVVAVYGFFSDPATITAHLDTVSGFLPGGAVDVARDQLTRVASKARQTLGLTFFVAFAVSLWSANAAMKSLFDTLNIIYSEKEKRGFIKLNALSLAFTLAGIVFVLLAIGAVVVLPVVLNYIGLSNATDLLVRIGRWPALFVMLTLALSVIYRYGPKPRETALALDYVGQRLCGSPMARLICLVLMVCRKFR